MIITEFMLSEEEGKNEEKKGQRITEERAREKEQP